MAWHYPGMSDRIYPKRPPRLFLAEWREKKHLTQEQLAARLGVSGVTVSRWETGKRRPNINILQALAEALGIEPADFYRNPDSPSADELLRGQPPEVVEQALRLIIAIRR